MSPACRRQGRQHSLLYVLMLVGIALGVVLMHSIAMVDSAAMTHGSISVHDDVRGHHTQSSGAVGDAVVSSACECPMSHEMMHPCAGVATAWPELAGPSTVTASHSEAPGPVSCLRSRAVVPGRSPPWALWVLDESVTLRV